MKGNEKVLATLNELLADELTAINQYMVHAEMLEQWGYGLLHKEIESQAIDEMHHAEWLIGRILFLEGAPVVSNLRPIKIGSDINEIIIGDQQAELEAVVAYNKGIALASEAGDEATADLLIKILKMEEGHVDWAEKQRAQIGQMGVENYLGTKTVDE
ncbi:MAG: bacterioferritin [Anaerolineales bacterium]